jgi:AbrB family looped-hinge helix DNA binding protein
MASFEVTLASNGQITIPVELRAKLNLMEGDKLEFYLDACDRLIVRPRNLGPSAVFENAPKSSATPRRMTDDEAISAAILAKDRRSRRSNQGTRRR